jgi:multiple sugar transport system ATP-binding protein
MDEPLSNLDAKLRTSMRAELKHLQRELATTTIYVTHDQIEAMTLADRIVILNGGKLQQQGAPAEIYARPANVFVAGFVGSPPMNLIEGDSDSGAFVHSGGRVAGLPLLARRRIVLGQRPEDLRLVAAGDLEGEVFSSELLGDSALIGVRVGNDIINVKVGPAEGRALGERVGLRFDPTKLHAFDAATGERLPGFGA